MTPTPIIALDFANAAAAVRLVEAIPDADFYKVGLQLFTAEGPEVVRTLKRRRKRVFLDLKFHDIPNTVAGAVRSAVDLEVDVLTVHAAGGAAMLRAAVEGAGSGDRRPLLFAVTVLTSLDRSDLARSWGREQVDVVAEVARLATHVASVGVDGVVASVGDVGAVRNVEPRLLTLTPGIRLPGDDAGDQTRIATPADAREVGADFIVLGRTVTAAADPAAAFDRVLSEIAATAA